MPLGLEMKDILIYGGIIIAAIAGLAVCVYIFRSKASAVIDKVEKKAKKQNGGCLAALITAVITLLIIMFLLELQKCSTRDHYEDGWEQQLSMNREV